VTPNDQVHAWPTAETALNTVGGKWRQLGVVPDSAVYFVYNVTAGSPDGTHQDFWFSAQALHDLDTNNLCAGFEVLSETSRMADIEEGDIACP